MSTTTSKIFLIGFMGCGKSTLGKKLANNLNIPFIDLDKRIEEVESRAISEIFATDGEDCFREIEAQKLRQLINTEDNYVVALGGGTPCYKENMELINSEGTSVYLKYNAGILTSRLINAKEERPLIAGKSKEELSSFVAQLLNQREYFYLKSDIVIEGNNITLSQVMELLLKNS